MTIDSLLSPAQLEYLSAQAESRLAKAEVDALEKEFCERHNLVNPVSGKVVPHVWMMTWDKSLFDVLNEKFCTENADACQRDVDAQNRLRAAENTLVEWGLSILPVSLRKVLSGGMSYAIRKRFIDITMKVDSTTIPLSV